MDIGIMFYVYSHVCCSRTTIRKKPASNKQRVKDQFMVETFAVLLAKYIYTIRR